MHDIVIIGGGITGLSAAHELNKLNPSLSVIILESSSRVGGKISTDFVESEHGNFLLEQGPDSFLTAKPWALELARELNLDSEIISTNEKQRRIFVLRDKQLRTMPDGLQLMVPTRFLPFATTNLISLKGKARAAFEAFIPKRREKSDESVASFVRRRLGQEMLDYLAEPLLAGIYNANAEKQSLRATFPQFADIEQKHGSLTLGMLNTKRGSGGFVSFKNGMQTLVSALQSNLKNQIQLNTSVNNLSSIKAKHILITTPAAQAMSLLGMQNSFRTSSSGSTYFAYRSVDIKHPLNGYGLVIPKPEKRLINAITWTSSKLAHRAPAGTVLLRVFFSGTRDDVAESELRDIMKIDSKPLFSRTYRSSNPQYDIGHLDKVSEIERALPKHVTLAGSSYRGVGIPDCVRQGKLAAAKIISNLALALFCVSACASPLQNIKHELGINDFSSFKRTPKTERWNLVDDSNWNRPQLMKDFEKLQLVNAIVPKKSHYHSAVLLGSTGPSMQRRINYLVDLWNNGTRFDRIVFLTGDRTLNSEVDLLFPKSVSNETKLFQHLWKSTDKAEALAQLPELWIDTPATFDADGILRRPTTVTTIVQWRETENLRNEDLLAISSQPTVQYQQCALENFIPKGAQIETVGPAANPDTLISVYLDVIAQNLSVCRSFP